MAMVNSYNPEMRKSLPKQAMLNDFLLDDLSSCSSNGFCSFPRRLCCPFTVQFDPNHKQKALKKNETKSLLKRAITAATKLLSSSSAKSPENCGISLLPCSLLRKLKRGKSIKNFTVTNNVHNNDEYSGVFVSEIEDDVALEEETIGSGVDVIVSGDSKEAESVISTPASSSEFQSKRILEGSSFDVHRAQQSQPKSTGSPPLDTHRAELSRQHVRALNTQFASWVQSQLQNHPDELWEDGVQDYLDHQSKIKKKFSDIVKWLQSNASKGESVFVLGSQNAPTSANTSKGESVFGLSSQESPKKLIFDTKDNTLKLNKEQTNVGIKEQASFGIKEQNSFGIKEKASSGTKEQTSFGIKEPITFGAKEQPIFGVFGTLPKALCGALHFRINPLFLLELICNHRAVFL